MQCSRSIKRFSFRRGWEKEHIVTCVWINRQNPPEESGIIANHWRVDILGKCVPLSFGLFPSGSLQVPVFFSFGWQLVELAVARACAPAFHPGANKQKASVGIVVVLSILWAFINWTLNTCYSRFQSCLEISCVLLSVQIGSLLKALFEIGNHKMSNSDHSQSGLNQNRNTIDTWEVCNWWHLNSHMIFSASSHVGWC